MTRVVEVPPQFDDRSFDQFAKNLGEGDGEERLLFDAHAAQWASPYGLVGLLVAGQSLAENGAPKPLLTVPQDRDVGRYWSRMGFFDHAASYFELHGKVPRVSASDKSDVLLEVTPVREVDDVHTVVRKIQERSAAILAHELGLEAHATMGFAMALSEACQNIVEHAGTAGWVAVQSYNWRKRLGRRVVIIAVCDAGIGFKQSLEPTQASRFPDRWSDKTALEAAAFQAISRFRDPGRGQGLQGIRRYLNRWSGKLSIRSGTARIAIVPEWDDDLPLIDGLPKFPGSQILMIIPEQERESN
ncbi:MAG: ATP-binding protein [Gemmatimonadales bacterium]